MHSGWRRIATYPAESRGWRSAWVGTVFRPAAASWGAEFSTAVTGGAGVVAVGLPAPCSRHV